MERDRAKKRRRQERTLKGDRPEDDDKARAPKAAKGGAIKRRDLLLSGTSLAAARFIETFKEFPPRQRPASFSVEQVMEVLRQPSGGG